MNVQMIENWSHISGTVVAFHPQSKLEDYAAIEVEIQVVTPVKDFPNMLAGAVGETITIFLPAKLAQELDVKPGAQITGRVRKAGLEQYFAHRHHIAIQPPEDPDHDPLFE